MLKDSKYIWLISNDMDTNLASTSCTYDRIVITTDSNSDYANTSGVFRFDQEYNLSEDKAKEVSDHYPVYATFYTNYDSDNSVNTDNDNSSAVSTDDTNTPASSSTTSESDDGGGCFIYQIHR